MLQIINKTPFTADAIIQFDQHGENIAATALKATFTIPENNMPALIAGRQYPVLHNNQYFDTPENSGIRYSADLIVGKKGTDIAVNGCVYNKNNKPTERVRSSVRAGRYYKQIEAVGDRFWKKRLIAPGSGISRPELFIKMPVTCNRLYGGSSRATNGETAYFESNPHGTGFIANKKMIGGTRLPNFEDPFNRIETWKDRPEPAGFGFCNPSAKHRSQYAGTYDDNWQKNQNPLYPVDLDLKFFNAAQPELITDDFMTGGETIRLKNLSDSGIIEFQLPVYQFDFNFMFADRRINQMANLYTVVIEPEEKIFNMVWGCSVKIGNQPSGLKLLQIQNSAEGMNAK